MAEPQCRRIGTKQGNPSAFVYVGPFCSYLVFTQVTAQFPGSYAWLYAAVVLLVGAITVYLLHGRPVLRPHGAVVPGLAVGLVGIALWIGLCHLRLEQQLTSYLPAWLQPQPRPAFNPFESLADPLARWGFLAMRVLGLAVLVPVVEELFWRGFLHRWLISPDWQQQELGRFTPLSFAGVTVLFALAHPEWLAAAVYCGLLNGLLYWKRDLWNCVVAHGVSNGCLAGYIFCTGTWELW